MTTWERIAEKARDLPPDKQRKVLEVIESLQTDQAKRLQDPAGLLADLGIDLEAEDLTEARKELWRGFPREAI